jgi:hypothetical protein
MDLTEELAPLSSQYSQLFDLQQTQHHGFSQPSLQFDKVVYSQNHPIHSQGRYTIVS